MIDLLSMSDWMIFVIAGLLGGAANLILEHEGRILFPRFIKNGKGEKIGLVLGFLGNLLVGIVVALIADTNFFISLGGAFAGNVVANKLSFKKRG